MTNSETSCHTGPAAWPCNSPLNLTMMSPKMRLPSESLDVGLRPASKAGPPGGTCTLHSTQQEAQQAPHTRHGSQWHVCMLQSLYKHAMPGAGACCMWVCGTHLMMHSHIRRSVCISSTKAIASYMTGFSGSMLQLSSPAGLQPLTSSTSTPSWPMRTRAVGGAMVMPMPGRTTRPTSKICATSPFTVSAQHARPRVRVDKHAAYIAVAR